MPIEKLTPSYNFTEDRLEQIRQVVPEAFADGQINWETLREILGEYLEDEDQAAERFGLFWPGKRDARRAAAMPPQGALVPASGEGVNEETTRHVFIEGENLEVLKLLRKAYAGRVKMIYIDPPYNTGNDFIYRDHYAEPVESYLRRTGQAGEAGELLTTNPKTGGRYHSNWLNMMYPRLVLARELLSEDGVIFVSIDDNEVHNLRQLVNEVFGEESFVADIVVVNNLKGRNDRRYIATAHERLLMFARDQFAEEGLELPDERLREFALVDERGQRYRLLGLRKRGGADTREKRPRMFFPLYVDSDSGTVALKSRSIRDVEVLPRKSDGTDGCWRWGEAKVVRFLSDLFGKPVGNEGKFDVFEKDYLATDGVIRRIKPKSVMSGTNYSTDGATKAFRSLLPDTPFTNPKPVPFLKDLLSYATTPSEGEIVFDFFAGSCSVAHAALELNREDSGNRRFIMVQIPEPAGHDDFPTIADIGKERIRRVIAKMQSKREGQLALEGREQPEDLGFRVYKLGRSQLSRWQPYEGGSTEDLQGRFAQFESPLTEGWDPDALRVEIMLQEGFPLDSRIERLADFTSNAIESVASEWCEHRLFLCLDETLDDETVDALPGAMGASDILVCLDTALTDESKLRLADQLNIHVI